MSRGRDLDERDALSDDRSASVPTSLRTRSLPTRDPRSRLERDRRDRPERSPRRERGPGLRLGSRRSRVGGAGQSYRLRKSEFDAMEDIGRFRTVTVRDLEQYRYHGNASMLREDMRSLVKQGLVQQRYVALGRDGGRTAVVTLTDRGKALLDRESALGNEEAPQEFHAGFVKPQEIAHDAALYRVYQAEAAEIEREGGTIERVVLDYELKGSINRDVNAAGDLSEDELDQLREEIAAAHHLSVLDRKIPLPDLRIEYQTANGDAARVDVELTTEHYKKSQIAAKAGAGFKVYALAPGGSGAGTPVRDEREITAGILSV